MAELYTGSAENRRQLDELNRLVLARSEHEIDFAFIALGELATWPRGMAMHRRHGRMRRPFH